MNENQQQGSSTPPPPPVPLRGINRNQQQQQQQRSTHSSIQNLAYQLKQPINISPSSSFAATQQSKQNNQNNIILSATMGSMQSLDMHSLSSHHNAHLIAGKTNEEQPMMPPPPQSVIKDQNYDPLLFSPLNGEDFVEGDDASSEIVYVLPDNKSIVRGRLTVTNFRLHFKSGDLNTPNTIILDIPLGVINRIEKIGHQSSRQQNSYGIVISCKDGRRLRFANTQDTRSRKQIFDTLQKYAFPLSNYLNFFAFSYKEKFSDNSGWSVYDAESEYKRMGIFDLQDWRFTDLNKTYELCDTYPKVLVVPKLAKDEDLIDIAEFRSKSRLPVLSWVGRDKTNQSAIYRSSQPCCGIAGKQSKRDEEYLTLLKDININSVSGKLAIMDARPQVNAMANRTKGGGYENEDNYINCELTFLNIQNIHVMRESLRKVFDMALYTADDKNFLVNLENSKWIDHLKCVLVGANKIVSKIHQGRTSVLVHCSDGWDRTAQLTSLAMIMLDRYYRTMRGFQVLIEKEWLSFGHRFSLRMGHGVDKHSDQDRSPIFVQFIDCVWQIQQQNKKMFEFNEEFLLTILKHAFTCQFGTFLYNSESEREKNEVKTKTISLWSYINSHETEFKNAAYVPVEGVITCAATSRTLRLWTNYYFQHKESTSNDLLLTITNPPRPRKNFFTQMIDQMKISKHSLASEPVLVKYNRTNIQTVAHKEDH